MLKSPDDLKGLALSDKVSLKCSILEVWRLDEPFFGLKAAKTSRSLASTEKMKILQC